MNRNLVDLLSCRRVLEKENNIMDKQHLKFRDPFSLTSLVLSHTFHVIPFKVVFLRVITV